MATGFTVSGRGDLDALFKARTSAAIANTGFTSNGGVDLAQRFEPRGATAAIADTGFRKVSTDLSQLFMSFGALAGTLIADVSMTAAANSGLTTQIGFQRFTAALADFGFISSQAVDGAAYLLEQVCRRQNGTSNLFGLSAAGSTFPVDADTTWQRCEIIGTFSDSGGIAVTRTLLRNTCTVTANVIDSGRAYRTWEPAASAQPWPFITGNIYSIKIFKLP